MTLKDYAVAPDGDVVLLFEDGDQSTNGDSALTPLQTLPTGENVDTKGFETPEYFIDDELDSESLLIRMRVSSARLTSTSRVFHSMLVKFENKEALALRSENFVEIPLPDDELAPFLIIMNALHDNASAIPGQVDLPMLTQIATLVDKYEWHGSMKSYARMWINQLRSTFPMRFSDDLPAWIWVFYAFRLPKEFQYATDIAGKESKGPISDDEFQEFPIPSSITGAIGSRRIEAISEISSLLSNLIAKYQEAEIDNDFRRKNMPIHALILGMLILEGRRFGLIPSPPPTFDGISFVDLAMKVRTMVDIDQYSIRSGDSWLFSWSIQGTRIKQKFLYLVNRMEKESWGLRLESLHP